MKKYEHSSNIDLDTCIDTGLDTGLDISEIPNSDATREAHLLLLAKACISRLYTSDQYGVGITMDCKRPFCNSGDHALKDTLDIVGVKYKCAPGEELDESLVNYALFLWQELPDFFKDRVMLKTV